MKIKHIPWYNKINPIWWFGNIDSPEPRNPEYKKNWPQWARVLAYRFRNPGHNFFYYIIGVADYEVVIVTSDGEDPTVLREYGSYSHWVLPVNHWLDKLNVWLPFYSYRGNKWEYYIGWRERGNFGMSFRKSNAGLA